jgi:hypothetical protein
MLFRFLALICFYRILILVALIYFIFYELTSQHGEEVCVSTMQQVRVCCTLPCGFSVLFSAAYFSSWFQLDFAVTISALLGIPFPFGRSASLT